VYGICIHNTQSITNTRSSNCIGTNVVYVFGGNFGCGSDVISHTHTHTHSHIHCHRIWLVLVLTLFTFFYGSFGCGSDVIRSHTHTHTLTSHTHVWFDIMRGTYLFSYAIDFLCVLAYYYIIKDLSFSLYYYFINHIINECKQTHVYVHIHQHTEDRVYHIHSNTQTHLTRRTPIHTHT